MSIKHWCCYTTTIISVGSVDEDNSLIIIEEGFSRPVNFEPLFMTPVVDVAIARVINETCGGNIECAFDIAVTGNVDVGKTTLVEIEEHMVIVNESLPSKHKQLYTIKSNTCSRY